MAKAPKETSSPDWLEKAVLIHAGFLLFFAAWAFGGNAGWSHRAILFLTLPAPVLALLAVRRAARPTDAARGLLKSLWPWLLLSALVIASCFNPSFRTMSYEGDPLLVHLGAPIAWLPSTVDARHTLDAWWFFSGIFLSCFNLTLVVKRRRSLRKLLLLLTLNTLALAVFGSLQKLMGSKGLYFGLQPSPQPAFFASFIYHNHWGAYIVLMTAALAGLAFYALRNTASRDFFHNPAFGGFLAILIFAATAPLSTSRSCTLLVALLLLIALGHGLRILFRRRSSLGGGVLLATLALIALAAIYTLGKPIIDARVNKTREQLTQMHDIGGLGTRAILYDDTWRMAAAQPVFGWGMGSYSLAFQRLYNSQRSVEGLPLIYLDAHSDWLQSLAELGFAGTFLLGLLGFIPLKRLRWSQLENPLVRYLLIGCALVLLYAWVEFPFGNGAVVIAFWLCFFCAIRHAQLDQTLKEKN